MGVERIILRDKLKKTTVKEFLEKEFDRAGCGLVDIQRTPMGTRVIVKAQRPGLVIGRRGATIRRLTEVLKDKYGFDNPQIEVNELEIPEFSANVMAKNVASLLERGFHFRRASYTTLRRIMDAGARGAEIVVSGKLTGERSRMAKFRDGYIKHCGEPAIQFVEKGMAVATLKQGVIGVQVKIIPPTVRMPDDIRTRKELEGETKKEEQVDTKKEEPKAAADKKEDKKKKAAQDILNQKVGDVVKGIRSAKLSDTDIDVLLASELRGKNRKTVTTALTKKKLQQAKETKETEDPEKKEVKPAKESVKKAETPKKKMAAKKKTEKAKEKPAKKEKVEEKPVKKDKPKAEKKSKEKKTKK